MPILVLENIDENETGKFDFDGYEAYLANMCSDGVSSGSQEDIFMKEEESG